MRICRWLVGVMVVAGCGGHSSRGEGGSAASAGAAADSGGASAGSAAAAPSFVPDDPQVSKQGDGRLVGGSFEGKLGNGWDFCCVTPAQARVTDAPGGVTAGDGRVYLGFDSSAASGPCPDPEVAFWTVDPVTDSKVALYFDVVNLDPTQPAGKLQIDATEGACVTSEPLVTIPLDQLESNTTWQTRCVTLAPQHSFSAFGLKLSGGPYHLGLDAFRFGPPCHAP